VLLNLIFVSFAQNLRIPMKKIIYISILSTAFFCSCNSGNEKAKVEVAVRKDSVEFFGDSIMEGGATPANQLLIELKGKDSVKVKVIGTIEEICQKKGCWMDINIGDGKTMKVSFKDYAFFVPKNVKGKTAIFEGIAYTDTIPVNQLRHYAEDEGKTKEDIAKITKPEITISFEARGVIIKK
jgi:hypothetical protein